ncbi:ABZJ_00895 family protein [Pseudomonas sp. IC_126]|uniref:ABZJ_00895 family protein n=1 Tax=Pseudomonas sp. IC_126 TaxID=2547400 RepID=UPI002113EF18|nr:ABZJ_00895 family protein [Pseudomonas sp. IC_126]
MLRRYDLATFGSRPTQAHGRLNATRQHHHTPVGCLATGLTKAALLAYQFNNEIQGRSMILKNEVSVINYVGLFALLNAALMLFFNVLAHGFDIDFGSGANIAMLMGASMTTSNQFVSINKRAPNKSEKNKLILGCLLSSAAISATGVAILFFVALGPQGLIEITRFLPRLSTLTWLAIMTAVTLFYYLMLNLSFGWHANRYATKIQLKA